MLTFLSLADVMVWCGFGLNLHCRVVLHWTAWEQQLINPSVLNKVRIIGCAQTYPRGKTGKGNQNEFKLTRLNHIKNELFVS